jgi:predicted protein tyrosine phosphatase
MEKYLFVCLSNENRSPTAESVCKRIIKEKGLEIQVSSAGIDPQEDSNANPLSDFLIQSCDVLFVMESCMTKTIKESYTSKPKRIVNLDIKDNYRRDDPELIYLLNLKLEEFFLDEGYYT